MNWAHSIYFATEDFEYDASANQANFYFFVGGQRIASYARFGDHYSARWVPLWLVEDVQRFAPRAALVVLLLGAVGVVVLSGRRRRPAWLARAGVGFLGGVMVLWPLRALPTGGGGGPSTYGGHGEENGVFYVSDHLGSTRAVINVAGSVVETRDYDPFGRDIAHTGDFQLKHRYTGQPVTESDWESVAPLYDYGARFYDPRWGRFLSPDTFVERLSSQGMNRYAYVGNQPTSRIDPTGHFGDGGGLGGIGGGFGGGFGTGFGDGSGLSGLGAVKGDICISCWEETPGVILGWGWGRDHESWGVEQVSAVLDVLGTIFGDARNEGGGGGLRPLLELARIIGQFRKPIQVGGRERGGSQGIEQRERGEFVEELIPAKPPVRIFRSGDFGQEIDVDFPSQEPLVRVTNVGGAPLAIVDVEIAVTDSLTLSSGANVPVGTSQELRFEGVFSELPLKTSVSVGSHADNLLRVEFFGIRRTPLHRGPPSIGPAP